MFAYRVIDMRIIGDFPSVNEKIKTLKCLRIPICNYVNTSRKVII